MKFDVNQRKTYVIALILLVIAIALVCVWRFLPNNDDTAAPFNTEPTPPPTRDAATPPPASPEPTQSATGGVDTVVYYQDNHGYLVPVMCSLPMEEGIAKATVGLMIKSSKTDMQAARLGLRTVIPENVTVDLDIAQGKARIDLSKEALEHADAVSEHNMVSAIVQTLTEFDTVSSVEFLFGGQKRDTLKHGTDVSGVFRRGDINLETASVAASTSSTVKKLTLYFPGESGSVLVPVTRLVYSAPDITTAVVELAKGPASDALEETLPMGCGLISVDIENGVAKINFTEEFMRIITNTDGGFIALKALTATCTQFEGVNSVEIYVEGELYDPGMTLDKPTFVNVEGEITSNYIQTQSDMIFDND